MCISLGPDPVLLRNSTSSNAHHQLQTFYKKVETRLNTMTERVKEVWLREIEIASDRLVELQLEFEVCSSTKFHYLQKLGS